MTRRFLGKWYIFVLILIVAFFSYQTRNLQLDDALIYLRYVKNFKDGLGLVYNPGEQFNGLTSLLFTYLMILLAPFFANLQVMATSLSFVMMSIAVLFSGQLLSKTKGESIFVALLISLFGFFYQTYGMESPLFLALIGLSLFLYKTNNIFVFPVLALLILTRSEGIFLAMPIVFDYVYRNRKLPDTRIILFSIVIFITPYLINYFYYGNFLAETGEAKIGQGRSGLWGEKWIFLNVRYLLDWVFSGSYFTAGFFGYLTLLGAIVKIKERVALIILVFFFMLSVFYIGLNIPNYHWYYAPFFYFIVIFAAAGAWHLAEGILKIPQVILRIHLSAIFIFAMCVALWNVVDIRERKPFEPYIEIGKWMQKNTPEQSSLGLVEIGAIGWYSNRNIVDILGLVNKYNAEYIGNRQFFSWLEKYQPTYVLRHDPAWPHEVSIMMLENNELYSKVKEFPFSGYVLSKKAASDEEIKRSVAEKIHSRWVNRKWLTLLAKSGPGESPDVHLETDYLFAHAPSTLTLTLDNPVRRLNVSYGLRKESQGKHSGVCFEIANFKTGKVFFHDCIKKDTGEGDMFRQASIEHNGPIGELIAFRTQCTAECNYAWSYWSQIDFINSKKTD